MEYTKHEFNIFPEMQPEDYNRLLSDLKQNGYDSKQPIYIYESKIIDGWNRYKACKELNIEPVYKQFIGSNSDAILFIMRTNKRRNLTSSQWAAIAAEADEIWDVIQKQVKEEKEKKQSENAVNRFTQNVALGNKLPEPKNYDENKSTSRIAETFNTNRTYISDAKKLRTSNPEVFEQIKSGEKTFTEVKREEKKQEQKERFKQLNQVALTELKNDFDVIVIDPPWEMEKIKREVAPLQVGFDYPTMTIDEIKNFTLPSSDNCHVFMWITHKHLPMGFEIFKSWGVKYILTMVWHKNGGFQPFGLPQYNCEFILYGRIGTPEFFDLKNFMVCFKADRTGHSKKPDIFYETIKRVTAGKRIDIFNRRKIDGFETWGNES